jgi:succinate dehydrogenase/fumarate reductase-like Fe-S protein
MYREMLIELVLKLQMNDEVELVRDMIINCGAYIQKVNVLEAQVITRAVDNPEDYRQLVSEMDKQRSTAHNALISSVAIINRLCKTVDMPPLFPGNIDNRIEVAEFAMKLVNEMFQHRRL